MVTDLQEVNYESHEDCEKVVEECWLRYFEGDALERAKSTESWTLHNLQLRLRDFATIVEAESATRAGDIGRLINMWKRWVFVAHGVKGLSHYALHIPRMILLLEEDLPVALAVAIKHTLLIPSSGRTDHCMSFDEYLEVYNYWLKHCYNSSVCYSFLCTCHRNVHADI